MQQEMDTIVVESREELWGLMRVLKKYMDDNPNDKDLKYAKTAYNILDVMDMTW